MPNIRRRPPIPGLPDVPQEIWVKLPGAGIGEYTNIGYVPPPPDPGIPAPGTDWVLAAADSPQTWKDRAALDNWDGMDFVCDGGTHLNGTTTPGDEQEIMAAWRAAVATLGRKTVTLAPGRYHCNWWHKSVFGRGGDYRGSLVVPGNSTAHGGARIITRSADAFNPAILLSVVRSPNINRLTGGTTQLNQFVTVPGDNPTWHVGGPNAQVIHTFSNLVFDGQGYQNNNSTIMASSGVNAEWTMEGIREYGSPGWIIDNCIAQNFRGSWGAGAHETVSIQIQRGLASDCTVKSTDGTLMAAGYTIAGSRKNNTAGGVIQNCETIGRTSAPGHGNAKRIIHGFAENEQRGGRRTNVTATGTISSGVRTEASEACRVENPYVRDCGTAPGGNGHGVVIMSAKDFTVVDADVSGCLQWGLLVEVACNFQVWTSSFVGNTSSSPGTYDVHIAHNFGALDYGFNCTPATGWFNGGRVSNNIGVAAQSGTGPPGGLAAYNL